MAAAAPATAATTNAARTLAFTPIVSVPDTVDAVTVPRGYPWDTILRWADPLFHSSPAFRPSTPDAEAQELPFGYNIDYLDIIVTDRRARRALLVGNHEYTNRAIMLPPTADEAEEAEVLRTLMAPDRGRHIAQPAAPAQLTAFDTHYRPG